MAVSKKDKLIEEAQRLAMRGQLDKAIKNYEQVISLDPSSVNHRQKLAELLVKAGRLDGARAEFVNIGKSYSKNGFYLKAIAVYKQIQKLFPADLDISLTLAELNEKHGLAGNALAEYKHVYDFYEKSGSMGDALRVLEKMQNVDPQNINIKLKLAEAYYNLGEKEKSYAEFSRLASVLQQRGDSAAFNKLAARTQQLFPDKPEFALEILQEQVENGNAVGAVPALQAMLRSNPNDKRVWELIVEAYQRLNQTQRVKIAYQHYLKFFPQEISAIRGLFDTLVAEADHDAALDLIAGNETIFVKTGAVKELVGAYKALHDLLPTNPQVLQGLKRAYEAAGDKQAAAALDAGLKSSKKSKPVPALDLKEVEADFSSDELPSFASDDFAEEPLAPEEPQAAVAAEPVQEPDVLDDLSEALLEPEEEIEIEIEIDDDNQDFGAVEPTLESEGNWLESVGEIFETIATSPRGVKFGSDLDTSDAQSHYDLGVAFKEMGLYDEAINEFRQASADPARRIECLVLQGVCLREKGDLPTAETFLRSLLNQTLGLEDSCAAKYELALTCEALGNRDAASALLAEIDAANPGFRDVRSRLDAAEIDSSLDFSDEDLMGFELK